MKAEVKQAKRSLLPRQISILTLSEIDSFSFCKASPPDNTRMLERGVHLNSQTRGVITSNIKRQIAVATIYVAQTLTSGRVDVRQPLMCQGPAHAWSAPV